MNKSSLSRSLARLFAYLFYGQIALYLFTTPVLIFMMSRNADSGQSQMWTPGDSVVIDSVRIGGKMIAALHDTTGTFRMNITSTPAALTIASVIKADSAFKANLNVDNVWTLDGYYVSRPRKSPSFGYTLPVGGRVNAVMLTRGMREGMPSVTHRNTQWSHRLSINGPFIELAEPAGHEDDILEINMNSWSDWLAIPGSLKLALLLTLLPALFSVLVTYQFKRLFTNIARNEVFSHFQLQRVHYIGYYALLYVVIRMVTDLYKVITIRRYVAGLGFRQEDIFQTPLQYTLTIQWSWLLMGLCILALAQVFRYGMELKQENELTI